MSLVSYKDVLKRLVLFNQQESYVLESGTNTTATADKLIDSAATFQTNSVKKGSLVYNVSDNTFTTCSSIDTETQLTLVDDNFTATGKSYKVYNVTDMVTAQITDIIIRTDQEVYDRLRKLFTAEVSSVIDTTLAEYGVVKNIALAYASYQVMLDIYGIVYSELPAIITSQKEWADEKLEQYETGALTFKSDSTNQSSAMYTTTDSNNSIFPITDLEDSKTVQEYFRDDCEMGEME